MRTVAGTVGVLAQLGFGGWEMILILAFVLTLVEVGKLLAGIHGPRRWISRVRWISRLIEGLGRGFSCFREATDEVAREAGRGVGGIYGKGAAQAITPDSQVAELYDPAVFQPKPRRAKQWKGLLKVMLLWLWIRKRLAKWPARTSHDKCP